VVFFFINKKYKKRSAELSSACELITGLRTYDHKIQPITVLVRIIAEYHMKHETLLFNVQKILTCFITISNTHNARIQRVGNRKQRRRFDTTEKKVKEKVGYTWYSAAYIQGRS